MNLLASRLELGMSHVYAFLEQLDLPSQEEYIAAASSAISDVRVASSSSWNLIYLTFRPLIILLGILSHHIAVVLRIIAKHSVAHGWIAAREGYFQLRTAAIWFINFQKDLPRSAKYAEIGVLAIAVALWLLRRHVQKYRYVERTVAWYREKKRRALNCYRRAVEKVAKTSLFMALLLPHLLYVVAVAVAKRMIPSVLSYLATRTYLNSIISFWHPLYLTVSLIGRLSRHLSSYEQDEVVEDPSNEKSTKTTSAKGKRRDGLMTPSKIKKERQQKIEMEELRKDVVDLLKYWVVFGIILAIFRTAQLLPVVGRILNVTAVTDGINDASIPGVNAGGWSSRIFRGKAAHSGFLSKIRLSGRFAEEARLAFFVWLRFMPVLAMGSDNSEEASKMNSDKRAAASEKITAIDSDKHRPVDIMYRKLAPLAVSAMNSSAFLTKSISNGDKEGKARVGSLAKDVDQSYFSMGIQKLRSILGLAVMLRVISTNTQDWIINTVVESSALLPASVTLLMPSYFTNYGVIYASLVVPSGYSIKSCDAIAKASSTPEVMIPKMDDASRYLQFWVVHAIISLFLDSLAPLLAWVPLSTHVTWLLWAYAQIESPTCKLYALFEKELKVFGMFSSNDTIGEGGGKENASSNSLEDSAVVRSVRKIISALPSNVESKPDTLSPIRETNKRPSESKSDSVSKNDFVSKTANNATGSKD